MPESPFPKLRLPVPPPTLARGVSAYAYAELDVTSNFSFLRGASHPDELVYRAAELGHRAIAITDINSLAGVVRGHQAAQEMGIKFCVGTRLRLDDGPDVLVWPENRAGYGGLCRLLTEGKRRAEKGQCLLHLNDLLQSSAGMQAALVGRSIDPQLPDPAEDQLHHAAGLLKEAFGPRLSIAVTRLQGPLEDMLQRQAMDLSQRFGIPLLASNQVHYHDPGRRMLQDVLACVRHGCTIAEAGFRLFANAERHLKSPEEMHRLFADLPAALRRTMEVAERCQFSLEELRYEYPDEIVPAGKSAAAHLAELTWIGAAERYPGGVPEKVQKQLRHELQLIEELHIEPYFLTVYDLVRFARSRDILCQGRGSAANSAVCYCLGVTSVDPNRIDVLFERFVSAARHEPPDIDIDFEHERREEVIQYVYEKYGRQRAGMTAEVISYRARSAVRDVGKAMGLGLDAVDALAKSLDGWHAGAPMEEHVRAAGLDPADANVALVLALTGELLGFPRHLSQHVGGMVMTRGLLCELVPIENATMADRTVIEWDKDDIDALGILKVDLLALGMLTALAKALKLINALYPVDPPLALHTIPAEDSSLYDMVCDADTVGVFQIESRAQMSMLPRLRPREFYDLVIEVAIVRPGPIQGDMVHPYLRRRQGLEPVHYPKPELKAALGKTLGVPLFQEQAMRIAIECAGFTPSEADRLRRAVTGFKRLGDIETFAQRFIEGMQARGFEKDFSERCFNQIRGFATYGFPESHAASFALLVYASAWIKRYHPATFCCALLNSQPMGFYAPAQLVRDATEHGVEVRPVDVNFSEWDCTLEMAEETTAGFPQKQKSTWGHGGPALRLGFRMVRGLAEMHGRAIAEARRRCGEFASVDHFHAQTHLPVSAVSKLSQADAFGSLSKTRRVALWETLALPEQRTPLATPPPQDQSPDLPLMSLGQEIHADYGSVGLSLKGHPMALLRQEMNARRITPAAEVWNRPDGSFVRCAGIVIIRQRPGTAKGIIFETLEDETGIVNVILQPEVFEHQRAAARQASLLQVDGYVQRQGQVLHVMAVKLHDLSDRLTDLLVRSRDFH